MNRVLFVDDDSKVIQSFRFSFSEDELKHIDFASTSDEAIELLDKNKYDKIICDLRLEGQIDGFQILRMARERGVKVRVLLTAVSTPLPIDGTAATYALRKPCDSEAVRTWALTNEFDAKRLLTPTI